MSFQGEVYRLGSMFVLGIEVWEKIVVRRCSFLGTTLW